MVACSGSWSTTGWSIRTLAYDQDLDSYQCAATLELRLKGAGNSKPIEREFEYDVHAVEDGDADFEIRYDEEISKSILGAAAARSMGWR